MRVEDIGNAKLILGDCLEVMATFPECLRVDALITDPPYGIGFKYASHIDSPEGYGTWLWEVISKAESFLNPGSPVFVFQAMKNVKRFVEWFPRDWRIFAACKNFVQIRPTPMQYAHDPVVCWWTEGEPWAAGTSSKDYDVADTAAMLSTVKGHPCPRPLSQMARIVGQWAKPGGTVFDPFMGSGTTGAACAQLGRKFLGIEIDPSYFDLACERVANAQRQERLFA